MTDRELMQQALKALDWISRAKAMDYEYRIKANEVLPALRARLAQKGEPSAEPVDLQDIEQYRMQMAGICTAALGYWKDGDSVHPDYDTPALREVAELYAKYAKLAAQPKRTPLTDEKINDEMDRLLLSPVEQEAFGAGVRYAERKHGIKG